MNNLAIITARSGSKGLPDKNIKLLAGRPLLAYSIAAAQDSGVFAEIFVSTDSAEYADIAKKYGASVPFLRSKDTAQDTSSSWDVVKETVKKYKEIGREFDTIALLQPTSPLRTASDIVSAYRLLHEKNADAMVAVCETDHSPLWCNILPDDLSMKEFVRDEVKNQPRQRLPLFYRINGALYIVKSDLLTDNFELYSNKCYAYIMEKKYSIDIDDEFDFCVAEMMLKSLT